MARGSIRKRMRVSGVRYEAVVDLGPDPVTGRRRQRTRSRRTRKEAQATLAAWLAEIDQGTAIDRSRRTVGDILGDWLQTQVRPNVRPSTLNIYEITLRVHLIPALGAVQVQQLTPEQVQRFYSRALDGGTGTRTLQNCHRCLRMALRWAVRLGLVARNATDGLRPPRHQARRLVVWDEAEARRFLATARQDETGALWEVALATGLRLGELLGLRWADVDLQELTIQVRQTASLVRPRADRLAGVAPFSAPKTPAARRTVPISPRLAGVLRLQRSRQAATRLASSMLWCDYDVVFSSGVGTPLRQQNVYSRFMRLVAQAGVPRIRIHDLRHTFATLALQRGMPLAELSAILGHTKISTTLNIYVHAVRHEAVRLGAIMDAALGDDEAAADRTAGVAAGSDEQA